MKVENKKPEYATSGNAKAIEVSADMKRTIDTTMSPETRAIGIVEGRLEYINIHGNRKVFQVYPKIGPDKIECVFPADKMEEVREALDQKVRVYGQLTYPAGSDFPKFVKVESIEILPEDDELPNLLDLRGIAPDITGDLSSEEFVRMLRDEHE